MLHATANPRPTLPQAKLYESLGDRPSAAHYYRANLERLDAEGAAAGSDTVDALLFLAEFSKVGPRHAQACQSGSPWVCA